MQSAFLIRSFLASFTQKSLILLSSSGVVPYVYIWWASFSQLEEGMERSWGDSTAVHLFSGGVLGMHPSISIGSLAALLLPWPLWISSSCLSFKEWEKANKLWRVKQTSLTFPPVLWQMKPRGALSIAHISHVLTVKTSKACFLWG